MSVHPGRVVAFLRGINLGNRRVKMGDLRRHVEAMGLEGVNTFIASGNVIFDPPEEEEDPEALQGRLEEHLEERLGFFTDVLIRPLVRVDELTRLPVVEAAVAEGRNVYVTFVKEPMGSDIQAAHDAMRTPDDHFHVLDREVLWVRNGGVTDSILKTHHLDSALGGVVNTRRKVDTLRKLVEKFGGT